MMSQEEEESMEVQGQGDQSMTYCTFKVGPKDGVTKLVQGQKSKLGSASVVFSNLFSKYTSQEIPIQDVKIEIFKYMIKFVETGGVIDWHNIKLEDCQALCIAGRNYQIPALQNAAIQTIIKTYLRPEYVRENPDVIISCIRFNDKMKDSCLQAVWLKEFVGNAINLINHRNFDKIPQSALAEICKQDQLFGISCESILIKACVRWAYHQCYLTRNEMTCSNIRLCLSPEILPNLRFLSLALNQFMKCVGNKMWLAPLEKEQLMEAIGDPLKVVQGFCCIREPRWSLGGNNLRQHNKAPQKHVKIRRVGKGFKGVALLLNHEKYNEETYKEKTPQERKGSAKDLKRLSKLLPLFGFDIESHTDLTAAELKEVLTKFSAEIDRGDLDCVLVIVMTHGYRNGDLFAYDESYNVTDVWDPLVKNQNLDGIPKVFLFQACRGTRGEKQVCEGEQPNFVPTKVLFPKSMPNNRDVLVGFATPEDNVSYRSSDQGSPYIQNFCQELMNMKDRTNIMSVLTNVTRSTVLCGAPLQKQTPCFVTCLDKQVFFEPQDPLQLQIEQNTYNLGRMSKDDMASQMGYDRTNEGRARVFSVNGCGPEAAKLTQTLMDLNYNSKQFPLDGTFEELINQEKLEMPSGGCNILVVLAPLEEGAEECYFSAGTKIHHPSDVVKKYHPSNCPKLAEQPKICVFIDPTDLSSESEAMQGIVRFDIREKFKITETADNFVVIARGIQFVDSFVDAIQSGGDLYECLTCAMKNNIKEQVVICQSTLRYNMDIKRPDMIAAAGATRSAGSTVYQEIKPAVAASGRVEPLKRGHEDNNTDQQEPPNKKRVVAEQQQSTDLEENERLLRTKENSPDVSFQVTDSNGNMKEISACSYKLAKESKYFENLCMDPAMKHSKITVANVTLKTFNSMLWYINKKKILAHTFEEHVSLMKAACQYQVSGLTHRLNPILEQHISEKCELVFRGFELFDVVNNNQLLLQILCDIFAQHADHLLVQPEFSGLSKNNLVLICALGNLHMETELTLIDACVRWAERKCDELKIETNDSNVRKLLGSEVIGKLRFLSLEFGVFGRGPGSRSWLSDEEIKSIYTAMATNGTSKKLPGISYEKQGRSLM